MKMYEFTNPFSVYKSVITKKEIQLKQLFIYSNQLSSLFIKKRVLYINSLFVEFYMNIG